MKLLRLALPAVALLSLTAPVLAGQGNKVTRAQLEALRQQAAKNPALRAQLTKHRQSAVKALTPFIGKKAARAARVYAEQRSRGGANVAARINTSPMITISIQIPAANQLGDVQFPTGDAPSALCLADEQLEGSWTCVDEEVQVTQAGRVRGKQKKKGK